MAHNELVFYFANVPSRTTATAMNEFFAKLGVQSDWDDVILKVSSGDDFVDGRARNIDVGDLKPLDDLAREYGFRYAVRIDWSNEPEGSPIGGEVRWVDGPAETQGNYAAELNSFRPVFTVPDLVKAFAAQATTVRGVLEALDRNIPNFLAQKAGVV